MSVGCRNKNFAFLFYIPVYFLPKGQYCPGSRSHHPAVCRPPLFFEDTFACAHNGSTALNLLVSQNETFLDRGGVAERSSSKCAHLLDNRQLDGALSFLRFHTEPVRWLVLSAEASSSRISPRTPLTLGRHSTAVRGRTASPRRDFPFNPGNVEAHSDRTQELILALAGATDNQDDQVTGRDSPRLEASGYHSATITAISTFHPTPFAVCERVQQIHREDGLIPGAYTNSPLEYSECRRFLVGRATSAVSSVTMPRLAPRLTGCATTVRLFPSPYWFCAEVTNMENRQATK